MSRNAHPFTKDALRVWLQGSAGVSRAVGFVAVGLRRGRVRKEVTLTFGSSAVASRPPRSCAALTNNPLFLAGVDGRSSAGRRYRDIILGLIREHGDGDLNRVRELAALMMARETAQAQAVGGDAAAQENLVRLANTIARAEKEMRARARLHQAERPAEGMRSRLGARYKGGGAP